MTRSVAATQGSLRPPPVGLAGAAERHFGLRLRLGDRLEGGFANHVFRVESDVGPLALRASHPPVDLDDLGWEHRVTGLLSARVPEVAAPLEAPDGSTWALHQGWALTLLPFAAGGPADRDDEAHRLAAARLLGRLHAAAAELAVPPRPRVRALRNLDWPPVRDFPETFDRGEIERARARAMETVAAIAASRPLREHVVHGDFFPGNVLVADGRVTGLVDWEEAHVGWATFELANAVWVREAARRG